MHGSKQDPYSITSSALASSVGRRSRPKGPIVKPNWKPILRNELSPPLGKGTCCYPFPVLLTLKTAPSLRSPRFMTTRARLDPDRDRVLKPADRLRGLRHQWPKHLIGTAEFGLGALDDILARH